MGTRGLKVIRFRGRYFVYWNQYDSYPEVLGQMIVNEIPTDPEQYKLWLQRQKALYAQMITDLEEKVLIVTDEKVAADLKRGASPVTGAPFQTIPPMYRAKNDALRPYEIVDDRLECFPSYFSSLGIDLWVEWMYIIDLDREILSMNSQQKLTNFNMKNISRDSWLRAVLESGGQAGEEKKNEEVEDEEDVVEGIEEKEAKRAKEVNIMAGEHCERKDHDEQVQKEEKVEKDGREDKVEGDEGRKGGEGEPRLKNSCPEAAYEDLEQFHYANRETRHAYKAAYQTYKSSIVSAKSQIDRASKFKDLQILSVVLFEKLITPSIFHLDIYLPSWSIEDVAFQEMAFTILSFAAGQYRFKALQTLKGSVSNGYLLHVDGEDQEVLPVLGSGCRPPGVEPDSSPQGTTYWFENVLVSLVPDVIIHNDAEVAIAKVVEFGLAAGNSDFYALVFSLTNAIMLHVAVEKGVKKITHTAIIQIMAYDDTFRSGSALEALCDRRRGFISLINFFNSALDRSVAPFNQGHFPTELYSKIHSFINDEITYKSLAKVSKVFRDINPGMITFGRDLKTIKFCAGCSSEREEWIFTFENDETEYVMKVVPAKEENRTGPGIYWSPVIGSKRPSIIPVVDIYFQTKTVTRQKLDRPSLEGWYGPFNSNACTVKVIWTLHENVTARQVEEIWAYYLQGTFQGENHCSEFYTSPYTYSCMLIPHYHEFSIMYGRGYMWVCTRRPSDGNTPQKRADTLEYVRSRLDADLSQRRVSGHRRAKDGEIVLVAFGLQATFFEWKVNGKDGRGSLVEQMHFDDCGKDEVRLKMESEMLMPLLKRILERSGESPDRTPRSSS